MKASLVLGSSSPRRMELLSTYFNLKILKPEVDEAEFPKEKPEIYVRRVATEKWLSLWEQVEDEILVCADTTVAQGQRIFGKAENEKEAYKMLKSFSGKSHRVISAVCVGPSSGARIKKSVKLVTTKVCFRKLEESEIQNYLVSREWQGKAGAYGIQGLASRFVDRIEGSLTNVIGLPLKETLQMIKGVR